MNDEERQIYLLGEIAQNWRLGLEDLDGEGKARFMRSRTFLEAGYELELFSREEGERIQDALGEGVTDSVALRDLLD